MFILGFVFIVMSCILGASVLLVPFIFIAMMVFSAFEEISKK